MKTIKTNKAPMAIGPYSQAIAIGNIVYTSGQIAINPETNEMVEDDIVIQTHQVIKNISNILNEAGSSLDNVIKTTVFVKNIGDFSKINEIYAGYFIISPPKTQLRFLNLPKNT